MKSSDGLLELKARYSLNAERRVDLTLTINNPEQVRLKFTYRVDLPPHVSGLSTSRSPLESKGMIPDGSNENFGWVLEVGELTGVEREIVVDAAPLEFVGLHTTASNLRAALSQLLEERS